MNDSSLLAENTPFCSLENCIFREQLKIYHPEHQYEEANKGLQVSYHIILQQIPAAKPQWIRASAHLAGHTTHSGGHLVQAFKLTIARLPSPVPGPSVPSKVCRDVSSSCLLCDSVITSSSWREREATVEIFLIFHTDVQ